MDFQPNRTLYCREEFCNVLSVFKRPDIVIATGNLAVTELGLDIQGRPVFLVMAELGPDPAQGAGSVGGCPLTFDPWGCCSPTWVGCRTGSNAAEGSERWLRFQT